ncbi:MAG: hypothetical protein IH944_03785 [Armatimonadetes bacterium]|nr:hypothetical protein [Armatimonadota bacterium]
MRGFADPEAADRAFARISELTLRDARGWLAEALAGASDPDLALKQLERWLTASSNATVLLDALLGAPELSQLIVTLLGASHKIGDVLAQNPEFSNFVLEPQLLSERPTVETVLSQADRLFASTSSHSHRLDRLRLIKQEWNLRIAVADLGGLWPEPDVWLAISAVAEGLLVAVRDLVWAEFASEKGLDFACPVEIVAFGKLGGRELNLSSDVDLALVLRDDADDELERHAQRFGEVLLRAVSDPMGRGSLYRVDMRLRPFGSDGALVCRMQAFERYYEQYAEPWEHLAMIRSRVLKTESDIARRWHELRTRVVFQEARGEWVIEDLLKMRLRMEEGVSPNDIKLGSGGIRDVEFLVQILQMLSGQKHESVRVAPTLDAIDELAKASVLELRAARELRSGYVFLRQVEHRTQLVGDLQTHSLPDDASERAHLGRRMGFSTAAGFESALNTVRSQMRFWYLSILAPDAPEHADRSSVAERIGEAAETALGWFDGLVGGDAFYASLLENESSLQRVQFIVQNAPALVPELRRLSSVTEQVITGEILEPFDAGERFEPLKRHFSNEAFAIAVRRGWLRVATRWAFDSSFSYGDSSAALIDAALTTLFEHEELEFSVVALGSFASGEMALHSDVDLLFLRADDTDAAHMERSAQRLLSLLQELRQQGAPLEIDVRLRPEGRSGRLVSSFSGLEGYAADAMEPWERFALGRSRLLYGETEALDHVRRAAYGDGLSNARLEALMKMKSRIENERIPVRYRNRHIKLGAGGVDDLVWTAQLNWMRFESKAADPSLLSVESRLRALASLGVFNAVELDAMLDAWRFFTRLRMRLALLGFNDEILPENPDKLRKLASVTDLPDGNEVLAQDARCRQAVRSVFEDSVTRLFQ